VPLQLGTHSANVGLLHLAPLEGQVTLNLQGMPFPILHTIQAVSISQSHACLVSSHLS